MSALALYNPNKSKITTTSSAITLREKKKNIVLSKREEKSGALVKMSGGESSLVTSKGGALVKISGGESSLTTKSKLVPEAKDKNTLKKKLLENNKKIIRITKELSKIKKVEIKTEKANINALKAEPAAEQKVKTEKFLEDKPKKEKKQGSALALPKPSTPSFLGGIFNYLLLTGFNWLVGKLSDKTSGLAKFFSGIGDVINNIAEWFPKFLDGTFGFIEAVGPFVVGAGQFLFDVFVGALDLAYGVYDGIRQTIGNLFGEKVRDQFDNFATKINEFLTITAAIGTALLLSAKVLVGNKGILGSRGGPRIGGGGGAPGGGSMIKPGKFGVGNDRTAEYINRGRAAKLIEKRYGNQAARAYQNSYKNALESGKSPTQAAIKAKADINKLFRTGKIIPQSAGKGLGIGGGGRASGPFGGVFRRGLGKAGSRLQTRVMGRGARLATRRVGAKAGEALGKIGSKLKVPVIGSIISVVMSLMNGDPVQKALFKGIGTAVGGIIGGALTGLGTFFTAGIGVFLAPIVMGVSAAFGDFVGDLLYTLFYDGGVGAAGKKLGDAVKGIVTGTGDLLKGIFNWVFSGGLFDLLKNVTGGIAKFALYLLNPGGLLWDILKAGGGALKAVTGFIFGGGLFDLIKNMSGGIFGFISYILNPGGLLFDALKQGGKIAKAIFDFAINAIGSAAQFIKDFIGGVFSRFVENFPTISIPEGWGVQTTLGKLLGWIPFLNPYMEGGKLTAFPDLTMFVPGLGIPFFIGHLGKSMFPGSFFENMPSGLGDAWKGAKNIAEDVTTKAVEGTKRAAGGIADALTFNLFDFDKKNEEGVNTVTAGGIADALTFNLFDFDKKDHLKVNAENVNKRIEEMKRIIKNKEEKLNKIPGLLEQEKRKDTSIINQMYERLREYEALKEAKGFNDGGNIKIGAQDFRDLAYIVSGEAARGTNDEYGVSAAVLNRVASPVWPDTVRKVGFQSGQFEAVYTGKAKDEPKLAEKLASPKGQASIASAMRLLDGRTDFKGQSMLGNKGESDVMFHPRGNFFHYTSQRKKSDPVPQNPNQSWKKLIGPGGPSVDLSTTSAPAGSAGSTKEKEKKQKQEMNPLQSLLKMLNIDFGADSIKNTPKSTSQISSPSTSSTQPSAEKLKTPAQISSSPSPALSAAKSNITKTSQSLPYQKMKSKPVTKVAVLIKEKTHNIIT